MAIKSLKSLPYDSPGQTYVAFEKPEGAILGKFSNSLKFIVKEVYMILINCLWHPLLLFFTCLDLIGNQI